MVKEKVFVKGKDNEETVYKTKVFIQEHHRPRSEEGLRTSLCMHTEWFVAFPLYVVPTVCPEARGMGNLEKSTGLSTVVTYS